MIWVISIAIYILTLVAIWFICLHELRKERVRVTIKDVVTDFEWQMLIPGVNTCALITAVVCWFVWDICRVNRLWDKIKDREL